MIPEHNNRREISARTRVLGFFAVFVLSLGVIIIASGQGDYSQDVISPASARRTAWAAIETPRPNPNQEQPAKAKAGKETPLPVGPDYKATNQALERTQKAVINRMTTATAQAEYYALMLLKSETENEIADNTFRLQVAHTGTAEAISAVATYTQEAHEIEMAILRQKEIQQADITLTEQEKNDHDLARYNSMRNTVLIILKIGIVGILVLLLMFAAAILRKAYANQKWQMDEHRKEQAEQDKRQMAAWISEKLAHEAFERNCVNDLVLAIEKFGWIDGDTIPRYDKLSKYISQHRRDQAVAILEKYRWIYPVEQGKATQLVDGLGSFRDLQQDIRDGQFPPTVLADQHIKKTYVQQLPDTNSFQQSETVERLGEGVYRGN